MALYSTHDMAFQSAWSGLVQSAQEQSQVLMGAPGGITTVSSHGHQYLVHQFTLAANGERQQVPIGRADDPNTTAALQEIQQQVAQSKLLIGQVRALAKLGYQIADPKTYSVLAAAHNAGLFQAGLVLVGSHAYGVLLNSIGIRANAYQTHDVDLSRRARRLAIPSIDMIHLLAKTGIRFTPVPAMNHKHPSTSYKEVGASQFRVDLLVPAAGDQVSFVRVPELNTYAASLPLLDYLLEDSSISALASRHGVVPVRVPDPARYAIHKLATSQLRVNFLDKSEKDLSQAVVLIAALENLRPGDLGLALDGLPDWAAPLVQRASLRILPVLTSAGHQNAADCLQQGLGSLTAAGNETARFTNKSAPVPE